MVTLSDVLPKLLLVAQCDFKLHATHAWIVYHVLSGLFHRLVQLLKHRFLIFFGEQRAEVLVVLRADDPLTMRRLRNQGGMVLPLRVLVQQLVHAYFASRGSWRRLCHFQLVWVHRVLHKGSRRNALLPSNLPLGRLTVLKKG